jgi:hypothetical protein
MIGVITDSIEERRVREFFEHFKTPWEFYKQGVRYDVVICSMDHSVLPAATLTVVYNSGKMGCDSFLNVGVVPDSVPTEITCRENTFPIYTKMSLLQHKNATSYITASSGDTVGIIINSDNNKVVRIAYDLFEEVAFLLSSGQPPEYAAVPTLELHIALLRDLMCEAGITFIEIPPVPYEYKSIVCLTHDIDFAGVRNHKLDHTFFGFLYRALWKTLRDIKNDKVPWKKFWKNLRAILTLPAIFLGLAEDFWARFDRYVEFEKGLKSTFFFLPYKGVSGEGMHMSNSRRRAGKYDIDDLQEKISKISSKGCEIGLHGLDAWHNPEKGMRESKRIESVVGKHVDGVRIHWLFFDKDSYKHLERAGFLYDSTWGYNDAVGFRAGTAQVYQPLVSKDFFELPLLIQDTALFYSGRMGVGEDNAFQLCKAIISNVSLFGGALVINWHDRSLEPERQWDGFYHKLLDEIQSSQVWFGTGSEVVRWFQERRNVTFSRVEIQNGILSIRLEGINEQSEHMLCLHVYGIDNKRDVEVIPIQMGNEVADRGASEFEIPLVKYGYRHMRAW